MKILEWAASGVIWLVRAVNPWWLFLAWVLVLWAASLYLCGCWLPINCLLD